MIREMMAIACCLLLAAEPSYGAPAPQKAVQEALLAIEKGEPVELRLQSGQKLRGRLEDVRTDSFDFRVAGKDRLEMRSYSFDEVKSIKANRPSQAGKVALYMLAGIGAFMVVLYAVAAAVMD